MNALAVKQGVLVEGGGNLPGECVCDKRPVRQGTICVCVCVCFLHFCVTEVF